MDPTEYRNARIIPFPKGGRDAVRRQATGAAVLHAPDSFARAAVDCSAWYHQAAMQETLTPRRP